MSLRGSIEGCDDLRMATDALPAARRARSGCAKYTDAVHHREAEALDERHRPATSCCSQWTINCPTDRRMSRQNRKHVALAVLLLGL